MPTAPLGPAACKYWPFAAATVNMIGYEEGRQGQLIAARGASALPAAGHRIGYGLRRHFLRPPDGVADGFLPGIGRCVSLPLAAVVAKQSSTLFRRGAGVCLASLGGAWHHCRFNLFAGDELGLYAHEHPQPVCVKAIALVRPRRSPAPPFDPLCAILAETAAAWSCN